MSLRSEQCPVSGMAGGHCPAGSVTASKSGSRMGPRGCTFSGFAAPGDVHAAFGVITNSNALRNDIANENRYRNMPMLKTSFDKGGHAVHPS